MRAALTNASRAALNPQRLARKAIKDARLIPDIMEGLKAEEARIRYGCAKTIRIISELRPELLYPQFDFFVRLLSHENKIYQWDAAFVLSQLARADKEGRFDEVFDKYFLPIPGPAMITAANVIHGGARIAQAKPHLADRIAVEVVKVARARYRTAECRNVAIGHAIVALGSIIPLLRQPARAVEFVRRQSRNPRPATRKKAERFLKSQRDGALGRARSKPA